MNTSRRSRSRNAAVLGAITAAVLALLPGTALADGEHGEGWNDCDDSSTAGVGGDGPVSSDDQVMQPPCHVVPDFAGGGGYAGSGGESGGGVATESDGGDDERDAQVAGCRGGAGGTVGGAGDTGSSGGGSLAPDSPTADVDTSSADAVGLGAPALGPAQGWSRTGLMAAAAPCPQPEALVGGTGDGFVAPNRIDAGAGAMAAASSVAPTALGAGLAAVAAGLAALRRRTRQ